MVEERVGAVCWREEGLVRGWFYGSVRAAIHAAQELIFRGKWITLIQTKRTHGGNGDTIVRQWRKRSIRLAVAATAATVRTKGIVTREIRDNATPGFRGFPKIGMGSRMENTGFLGKDEANVLYGRQRATGQRCTFRNTNCVLAGETTFKLNCQRPLEKSFSYVVHLPPTQFTALTIVLLINI